jgi:hypothetical protein
LIEINSYRLAALLAEVDGCDGDRLFLFAYNCFEHGDGRVFEQANLFDVVVCGCLASPRYRLNR